MVASSWFNVLPQYVCVISDLASQLVNKAYTRVHTALRPRTSSAYQSKFKLFLAFIAWFQFPLIHVDTILGFLEFLTQNGSRSHSLASYVSVLRHYFKLYDIQTSVLDHRKVHLFIKSVSINAPYIPRHKANITIPILTKIVKACDLLKFGFLYKAIFLMAYFGFLRLSNMAPSSSSAFDPSRHFLVGDVIFGSPGAHIIVKWAKAMQHANKHQVVQLPLLSPSPLCPVSALKSLISTIRAPPSAPLFLFPSPSGNFPISAPMVSSTLTKILISLKLNPSYYGFHAFRRSAVSWAVDHNVPLQNLKAHGGWSSNAINTYFKHTPKASSTVATTFQNILQS